MDDSHGTFESWFRLHDGSVILVDDCDLPAGGKGGKLIPYLLENGWKTLETGYQVLLVRA